MKLSQHTWDKPCERLLRPAILKSCDMPRVNQRNKLAMPLDSALRLISGRIFVTKTAPVVFLCTKPVLIGFYHNFLRSQRILTKFVHHSKAETLTFPTGSHTHPRDTIQRISPLPLSGPPRVHDTITKSSEVATPAKRR